MKEADSQLIELCGKVRDETVTPEELAALEARLAADPAARQYYLRFMQLDALLEKFPPLDDDEFEESISSPRFVRLPLPAAAGWLAVAAALTLLATLAFFRVTSDGESRATNRSIAVLIFSEGCEWSGRDLIEGQRLGPGKLELKAGTAVIRFTGGAEAVLSGRSALELTDATSAVLIDGEIVIRAENGAEGFILDTPTGRLIDMGTEFAVKIRDDGDTELHVHEGEVAVGEAAEEKDIIAAGHAVRVQHGSLARSEVTLNAPRFRELIERAKPRERRDLMTHYEGFYHDPGSYDPSALSTGKGWAGPWRLRAGTEFQQREKDSSALMTIAHSQMEIAWPLKGGQAGMLEMPPGQNVRIRQMKKPLRMGKWGIHYFSFLVTEPDHSKPGAEMARPPRSDLRVTFRSSDDYFGESLSLGWGSRLQPWLSSDLGSNFRSLRQIPTDQTVFCVAKITTRNDGTDEVAFRFYTREDPLDIVEPAEWDLVTQGIDQKAAYDLLLLTSDSNQVRYLDEIRIGPSWRSVTPVNVEHFSALPES